MKKIGLLLGLMLVLIINPAWSKNRTDQSGSAHKTADWVDVYRSPTCACCEKWIQHLSSRDFKIRDHLLEDVNVVKSAQGIPPELASCHTAIIDNYVIEGHVPAAEIEKLLRDKPKVKGISVPGMPQGSPGMETGRDAEAYQVISFDKQGQSRVFGLYP